MKSKLAILLIVLVAGFLYTFTLRGVQGNPEPTTIKAKLEGSSKPFELSPERGRFAHVMALASTGQYALTDELGEFVRPDVGYFNGKFYSFFAPGISYLTLPFYQFGLKYGLSQVTTFSFISLVSILALVFIFKISRNILKLPIWASVLAVLVFAFGSTAWSYAITLYQHHVTVFLLLSSFYAAWKFKDAKYSSWFYAGWVGIAYGIGAFIDYPNLFLMLPVVIYLLINSFKIAKEQESYRLYINYACIAALVTVSLVTSLHFYHNQTYFGSWKRLSGSLVGYKTLVENNLIGKSNEEIIANTEQAAKEKQNVVKFFSEEKIPSSPGTLLFSKDRGLFFYSPIFILALLGLWFVRKKISLEIAILIAIVLFNLFLYSGWGDPWGGWAYGPRYLIPSMSVLAMFTGLWVAQGVRLRVYKKLIFLILFAYSSGIALLGALTTNAVPPEVEAASVNLPSNFVLNYRMLLENISGSFVYKTYFADNLSLINYGFILYGILIILVVAVLFIPEFARGEKDND